MTAPSLTILDATRTAALLNFSELVNNLETACLELADGKILAPERQVLGFPRGGTMLSMPATAHDIGIHKLVNVMPDNDQHQLPTICGIVSVYDGQTGRPLFLLDGPTVTARRTAAVSMLGLKAFSPAPPTHLTMIGYGTQASGHAQALAELYPGLTVSIVGRNQNKAQHFIDAHRHLDLTLTSEQAIPEHTNAVITVTTSIAPVYNHAAIPERLIVGVGAFRPDMAEIGLTTLRDSQLYVDELEGARHEAGDFIQAGIDWTKVTGLADALRHGVDHSRPIVYKTVGCSAWDLAAARTATKYLDTI